jgi:hypothetical protein
MRRKSQVAGRMPKVGNGLADSKVQLQYSPIDNCKECCVERRRRIIPAIIAKKANSSSLLGDPGADEAIDRVTKWPRMKVIVFSV